MQVKKLLAWGFLYLTGVVLLALLVLAVILSFQISLVHGIMISGLIVGFPTLAWAVKEVFS